jgi:hypothetical protein
MRKVNKNCEHNFKLVYTDWQYPSFPTTTSTYYEEEYAYLVCEKCWKVIKIKVENMFGEEE